MFRAALAWWTVAQVVRPLDRNLQLGLTARWLLAAAATIWPPPAAMAASAEPARAAGTSATYRNPILFGDYSDPDVVRVGADYYLVSSSFQNVPGLPILHSRDLVSWSIVGHAVERLPPEFDRPQHGNGLWAPSLRHHDGYFWIYVGDPDRGIFMTRARDPRGPWEPLALVKPARGAIDPCPLWDADGSVYLVHAWAKSRAGFNGVLTVNRLSPDGRSVLDAGTTVFDGGQRHPTIEGPKFYRREGWYYIFAPAGGVKTGWQTVLRSRAVLGPYEDRIVLAQGATDVNGPHQGAWVESPAGESWFVHFQDRGPYGRIVHLQPMAWRDGWPVIGEDRDGDGQGEPVRSWTRPAGPGPDPPAGPQRTDSFDRGLGLQWQWHGNPVAGGTSTTARPGFLRLRALPPAGGAGTLWNATHLLLQKLPAESFTATARLDPRGLRAGERAGLVVMGTDYAVLAVERTAAGLRLRQAVARNAGRDGREVENATVTLPAEPLDLIVDVAPQAVCRFRYAAAGAPSKPLGAPFVAQPGRWIGAKVGLFALAPEGAGASGHADVDSFRVEDAPSAREGLVVAPDGGGDFRTVQAALDAIPAENGINRTIVVRDGVYREKVFITASHVALVGEDRSRTRLEYAELRRHWRAAHPDDWGAAVVNIGPKATDVVLANLTVHNDHGRRHGDHDHQFAIRSMGEATRIALLHVDARADGGDTVSLWNDATGVSFAADSSFEGHVDFVCPRGWSYVTNSRFFSHSLTASLWHDGSKDRGQKLVVRRSRFDGVPGFALGRHHRDAQFYLLDAEFSSAMADRPIYAAASAPEPPRWGTRAYYSNARRDGGVFTWLADNLHTAEGAPRDEDVTAAWALGGRWDPRTLPAVLPFAAVPEPEDGWKWVEPSGARLRWTPGRDARAHRVFFGEADPPPLRGEREEPSFDTGPLRAGTTYHWRVDAVTARGVVRGRPWSFRADPRAVRILLAGDSTVTDASGWGRGFKARVAATAAVVNAARGGRSSKSYAAEGHWAAALARRPTHVLLQFGHNDQAGKGPERETDLPTYRANLERYVTEARAAGAEPVIVTSLTRRRFTPVGRVESDLEDRAEAARAVAAAHGVPLVDLHAASIAALERLGAERGRALGPLKADGTMDETHLNEDGAALFGALVAEGLASSVPALAPHLRRDAPGDKESR
jgi:beta-xylosidase/lysophospholipase L1-like esterase